MSHVRNHGTDQSDRRMNVARFCDLTCTLELWTGTCFASTESADSSHVRSITSHDMVCNEGSWCEVTGHKTLVVACLYRPPGSDLQQFASDFEISVNKLPPNQKVLIVGDFNATSPNWCPTDTYNEAGRVLEPLFQILGLTQHMTAPTHLRAKWWCWFTPRSCGYWPTKCNTEHFNTSPGLSAHLTTLLWELLCYYQYLRMIFVEENLVLQHSGLNQTKWRTSERGLEAFT